VRGFEHRRFIEPVSAEAGFARHKEAAVFRHILYATDGSEHALKALNYVCELAKLHRSAVTVVHAYPSPTFYYPDVIAASYYDELIEQSRQAAEDILDEAARKLKLSSVSVTKELIEGSAANAILKAAKTHRCDLIVMGARGLSDLQGLLLGSVSHRVIQHTTCPVLIIR
jgi:nucleotide-binding universal stress UspA family protein